MTAAVVVAVDCVVVLGSCFPSSPWVGVIDVLNFLFGNDAAFFVGAVVDFRFFCVDVITGGGEGHRGGGRTRPASLLVLVDATSAMINRAEEEEEGGGMVLLSILPSAVPSNPVGKDAPFIPVGKDASFGRFDRGGGVFILSTILNSFGLVSCSC